MSETALYGLDLSKRRTGVVALFPGWYDAGDVRWYLVRTALFGIEATLPELGMPEYLRRCSEMCEHILSLPPGASAWAVSSPLYRPGANSSRALLPLHTIARLQLSEMGVDWHDVTDSAARRTLLGPGGARQKIDTQTLLQRIGCPFAHDNDLADAFAFANHLASLRGEPFLCLG